MRKMSQWVPNMLLEISGEITPETMKRQSQRKSNTQLWMWLVVEVEVQCCKEQYCIGTWNVRSMNQGKLEVVKQEMARVNVNILGISEVKRTGISEFNSGDHYIYYCGQESLRRIGVAIMINERVQNAVLGCNLNNRMISVHFQGKSFNITVIQVYALISLWWPIRPSRNNTKKDVLFIIGHWNAKAGSQETPGVTGKFGLGIQNEQSKG